MTAETLFSTKMGGEYVIENGIPTSMKETPVAHESAKDWETQAKESNKVYQFTVPNLTSDSQHQIAAACVKIARKLLGKNDKYGNSALRPIRIFSKADSDEQLKVRIDDKVNRYLNAPANENEDVLFDLIGYLILLWIKTHDTK